MVARESIRPPKFADKFALLDFEAPLMPAISLYPLPPIIGLDRVALDICVSNCKPRRFGWGDFDDLPHVRMTVPMICQIFNWSEVIEWGGIRLVDILDYLEVIPGVDEYFAFHSRDGVYFETLPAEMARDPRVLLATHVNGEPLPEEHGGPLRLVVPFLQGYKSVKWLSAIRTTKHDPIGIKRLLGQSKTGHLGLAWRDMYGIEQDPGAEKNPV